LGRSLLGRCLLGRGLLRRGLLGGGLLVRRLLLSHHSTSSTATRCATVATMPRISGRSSLTTTSPIRFRPRVRSVSRWFCLPPISDFNWVTFRRGIRRSPPQAWPCRPPAHAGGQQAPRGR